MFSNLAAQKITEEAREEKTYSGVQETEGPLAVNMTINKNDAPPQTLPRSLRIIFSKNTFGSCY